MYRKRRDKEFVIDMFLASQNILLYTEGMDLKSFCGDYKTIDAVVRNIEILGEAVKISLTNLRINIRRLNGVVLQRQGINLFTVIFQLTA